MTDPHPHGLRCGCDLTDTQIEAMIEGSFERTAVDADKQVHAASTNGILQKLRQEEPTRVVAPAANMAEFMPSRFAASAPVQALDVEPEIVDIGVERSKRRGPAASRMTFAVVSAAAALVVAFLLLQSPARNEGQVDPAETFDQPDVPQTLDADPVDNDPEQRDDGQPSDGDEPPTPEPTIVEPEQPERPVATTGDPDDNQTEAPTPPTPTPIVTPAPTSSAADQDQPATDPDVPAPAESSTPDPTAPSASPESGDNTSEQTSPDPDPTSEPEGVATPTPDSVEDTTPGSSASAECSVNGEVADCSSQECRINGVVVDCSQAHDIPEPSLDLSPAEAQGELDAWCLQNLGHRDCNDLSVEVYAGDPENFPTPVATPETSTTSEPDFAFPTPGSTSDFEFDPGFEFPAPSPTP